MSDQRATSQSRCPLRRSHDLPARRLDGEQRQIRRAPEAPGGCVRKDSSSLRSLTMSCCQSVHTLYTHLRRLAIMTTTMAIDGQWYPMTSFHRRRCIVGLWLVEGTLEGQSDNAPMNCPLYDPVLIFVYYALKVMYDRPPYLESKSVRLSVAQHAVNRPQTSYVNVIQWYTWTCPSRTVFEHMASAWCDISGC